MTYTVLRNLKHDNVNYTLGDKIEASDEEQVKVLLEDGVIKAAEQKKTVSADPKEPAASLAVNVITPLAEDPVELAPVNVPLSVAAIAFVAIALILVIVTLFGK